MTGPPPADDRRPIATVAIIGNDALLAAAPATPVQLAHACLRRGFTVAVPVTWGDELLAAEAVRQLASRARGPAVMCVCPFVRSRLLAPGPDLAPFLVSLVPPPIATARYLRTVYGDRGVHITYIGACPGADDETIDARLTPDAFLGDLAEQGIALGEQPLVFDSIVPPDRRRWCSLPGGVPSAEVLWSDTDTRTLVEIERDEISTDLAQHIIARDHVLLDLAPSLGCSCSGSIPSLTPRSARVAVTALEPPRALGPVIEPPVPIALDVPVSSVAKVAEAPRSLEAPLVVAQRTQQEIDHEARERALDMILGGEPAAPTVTPRRHAPVRADARPTAPAATAPPVDMTLIEPVIARAEQQMASAMSSLMLETLIDDILIQPLIIPETKSAPDGGAPTARAEPVVDRAPARIATEVVVELDVVREELAGTPTSVRHENGSPTVLTSQLDLVDDGRPANLRSGEGHHVPLEPVELPDPSDVEISSSDSGTMADMTPSTAPGDVSPPFEDDELFGAADNPVEDDGVAEAATEIRRRTPPAMPARHPASAIPKAVSAGGRPLPRAYVAKRRVTPTGHAVIPPASHAVTPEPKPVAEQAPPLPAVRPPVEVATTAPIEQPARESVAAPPEPIAVETFEPEALVRPADPDVAPPPALEDEAPSASESVWGVTVEAPIVAKPTTTAPPNPVRPTHLAAPPTEVPAETVSERPPASVAPAATSNALITIVVVALVTLAVSVFVLLRR